MDSFDALPWHDRPARPFPARLWLKDRYPFYVPPVLFAWAFLPAGNAWLPMQRPFPAKDWRDGQQRASVWAR